MCRPVVKWVGGKRQLMKEIKNNMPANYNNYFEPFIGGGALFFELKNEGCYINDYNDELINLYQVIKDNPVGLIEDLKHHTNTEDYYYHIREMDRSPNYSQISTITRASRLMFLNRTGYNGLYRVNRSGQNNVPFGRYKNPKIVDEENIMSCSELLQKTTITKGDFENIKGHIKKEDFIYFDPPYVPISDTSSFTSYTANGFDDDMQRRLKILCDYIDDIGAYFMLSNSCAAMIQDLYKKYTIKMVTANRALNCKANGRGKVNEVLVMNYKSKMAGELWQE